MLRLYSVFGQDKDGPSGKRDQEREIRQSGRQAAHSAPNTTATTRANAAAMANRSIVDVQAIVTSVG